MKTIPGKNLFSCVPGQAVWLRLCRTGSGIFSGSIRRLYCCMATRTGKTGREITVIPGLSRTGPLICWTAAFISAAWPRCGGSCLNGQSSRRTKRSASLWRKRKGKEFSFTARGIWMPMSSGCICALNWREAGRGETDPWGICPRSCFTVRIQSSRSGFGSLLLF